MRSIIGAGSAEGAMDAANILKPYLSRSEIQIIGATTNEEYTKYIEKKDEKSSKKILFLFFELKKSTFFKNFFPVKYSILLKRFPSVS